MGPVINMPATIARRNTRPATPPKLIEAMAGPGQNPARPQPMPKSAEPAAREGVMLCSGREGRDDPRSDTHRRRVKA